jgi:hypothetical protein
MTQLFSARLKNVNPEFLTIDDLDEAVRSGRELELGQHCYCCTAGEGSSCTGSLAE